MCFLSCSVTEGCLVMTKVSVAMVQGERKKWNLDINFPDKKNTGNLPAIGGQFENKRLYQGCGKML